MKQSYQDGHKFAHGDLHPSCRHEVCAVFRRWQADANSTVGVHAADSRDWSGDKTETVEKTHNDDGADIGDHC